MPEVGKKSNTVLRDETPAVTWELSHVVVGEDGLVTTFCVYEAPDEEIVREARRPPRDALHREHPRDRGAT